LQTVACLCRCAAAFEPSCEDAADAMSCLADFAFWSVMGCMAVQINNELKVKNHKNNGRGFSSPMTHPTFANVKGGGGGGRSNNHRAPQTQNMSRSGGGQYQAGGVVTPTVTGHVVQQTQPQQTMQVQCPQGAHPGQMIQVADPYGRLIQVVIPNGVYPGQMFMIQVAQ
jgi:hypothetical protein